MSPRGGLRERLARLRGSTVIHDLAGFQAPLAAVGGLEPELQALDDPALRSARRRCARRRGAAVPRRDPGPGLALVREAARRALGLRPSTCRWSPASRSTRRRRRDADRRGQDAGGRDARLPERARPAAASTSSPSTTTWRAATPSGWARSTRCSGLSVGWVDRRMQPPRERRRAYAADVTYVTAKEAGFDHLRDLLALDARDQVHRPFHFALVDEADSLLIDEARVPLVIAGSVERGASVGAAAGRGASAALEPGVALRHRRVRPQRRADRGGLRARRAGARLRQPARRRRTTGC